MMKRILTMSLLAVSVVACDPYGSYSFKSGTASIVAVTTTDADEGWAYYGTGSGANWTVAMDCPAVCKWAVFTDGGNYGETYAEYNARRAAQTPPLGPVPPTLPSDWTTLTNSVIFVTFDRQIDGAAIQDPGDPSRTVKVNGATVPAPRPPTCDPAGGSEFILGDEAGDWLTMAGATLPAGQGWYSCYTPASPADREGGSAVIFANVQPPIVDTTALTSLADDQTWVTGWGSYSVLPDPAAAPAISVSGTPAGVSINVTVNRVDPTTCPVCD